MGQEDGEGERGGERRGERDELLQQIVVQVIKDPLGSKGARLTTQITVPARHLVLVPDSRHVVHSRWIMTRPFAAFLAMVCSVGLN